MKATVSFTRLLAVPTVCFLLAAAAQPALAQKAKTHDLAGFPLWSAKKNPLTGPFVPGLNATLLLTDEQKGKLIAAREEIMGNEKLQKLGATIKQNPNASEAERDAARKVFEEARDQFKDRVDTILAPEQRKLVGTLNGVFEEVTGATHEAFRDRAAQLKGDKAGMEELQKEVREKVNKDFRNRIEGLLSKAQWLAFTQAVEAEEAAAKNSVKIKKP